MIFSPYEQMSVGICHKVEGFTRLCHFAASFQQNVEKYG